MTQKLFSAQALTKTYTSGEVEVRALRGLDLDIAAGEVVVLLGPSGSGKSTLLNIMGGLDHASSGHLFFKDLELTALDDTGLTMYRREHVGFVFQFYNLMPSLTAYENVALVTEIAKDPMRPDEALALVGLEERMDHFLSQLSGGEQQRVAIARAIAKRPEVLLCDEPTGALDSKTGVLVIDALLSVNSQLGTTALIITYNASIQDVADRVLFFADGHISRIHKNETRRLSTDAVQIKPGSRVRIDGWGGSPIEGRVTRVDPAGFMKVSALGIEEQRVRTIIDFADPPESWSRLGHEFRVIVHVTTWSADKVLRVPVGALFRRGDDWAVFSVKEGRARASPVKIGNRNSRMAEVLSGLTEGDPVVLHPSDRIGEGTAVQQRESQ